MIRKTVITRALLEAVRSRYPLRWLGIHGVIHWAHVYENGIRLAGQPGVCTAVVQLFSLFHDSQRLNDEIDDGHGGRGAMLAQELRPLCRVTDQQFELLLVACRLHTDAQRHDDITVQVCFDADRLDLGRVGIIPDPKRLCSPLARERKTLHWAYQKSLVRRLPQMPFDLDDAVVKIESGNTC